MESNFLCKDAALGLLFKGYLHNLRGPVQALLMQIELLENRLSLFELSPEVRSSLEDFIGQLKKQVFRLTDLLASAEFEIQNEDPGPWDLRELIPKEITFWEAQLEFKHKVAKAIQIEAPLRVKMPLNRLKAGLCAALGALVPELASKSGSLEIYGQAHPPQIEIRFSPPVLSEDHPYLKLAREILAPQIELKTEPSRILLLSHA